MKFSDDMRFPHPVLTPETGDFMDGEFDLALTCEETTETGKVTLRYLIDLTQVSIRALVEDGRATVGLFVRCGDTYYSGLHPLGWPGGSIDFAAGALLNRVIVRPLIWLNEPLEGWESEDFHEEFAGGIDLGMGEILALGYDFILNIGQARLAPLESIFALKCAPELQEGKVIVKLDEEKITILAGTETHQLISRLRGESMGRAAALNSIYFPAVMEVLDALHQNPEGYSNRRWKQPFLSRCDAAHVDPENGSLFEDAQKLLDGPISGLRVLVEDPR